jgi:predicted ATPase
LFLDDLQWGDNASLAFIQRLLLDHQVHHLLIIGAYRDNDVSGDSILQQTIATLTSQQAPIQSLVVHRLREEAIQQMVGETLSCEPSLSIAIAAQIWKKSQGNPFFSRQIFTTFYQDNLIYYDYSRQGWRCLLDQIERTATPTNMVDFMGDRLHRLSPELRSLLSFAACSGNQFSLENLGTLANQSILTVGEQLWTAIQTGFIQPTHPSYRLYQQPPQDATGRSVRAGIAEQTAQVTRYRFVHDSIQRAAYLLIEPNKRSITHLSMGRRLRDQLQLQLNDQSITAFLERHSDSLRHGQSSHVMLLDRQIPDVANQLNYGIPLIGDLAERAELAALNLAVGQRALAATAYPTALGYAVTGISLLSDLGWNRQYRLTIALHELAAETAYLCGKFEQSQHYVAIVQQQSQSLLDQVPACEIQIKAYVAAGDWAAAVQSGLTLLRRLGVSVPARPTLWQAGLTMLATQVRMRWIRPNRILQLPEMTDPRAIAITRILHPLTYINISVQPNLIPTLVSISLRTFLRYGRSPYLAYACVSYGSIVIGFFRRYAEGYTFGKLALRIAEHYNDRGAAAQIEVGMSNYIKHWHMPMLESVDLMTESHQNSLTAGQVEMACWALHIDVYNRFYSGENLDTLTDRFDNSLLIVDQLNQREVLHLMLPSRHLMAFFRGETIATIESIDKTFSIDAIDSDHNDFTRDRCQLFTWGHFLAVTHYHFGDLDLAYHHAQRTATYLDSVRGLSSYPLFKFYAALISAACYDRPHAPQSEQRRLIKSVLRYFRGIAQQCPANYSNKFALLQAEWYRITGNHRAAIAAYDQAIMLTTRYGIQSELGLANLLAGEFQLAIHQLESARHYLGQARQAYQAWGATAKVAQLEQRYPQFLGD